MFGGPERLTILPQAFVFPGKGLGPGFSLSGRPLALDRTLNLYRVAFFVYIFTWFSEDSRSKMDAHHKSLVCFPGKGNGPGFSFSCRPLALDRTLSFYPRRIFLYAFLCGFLKERSLLYAFLQGLLNPAYGNVVFSRSKLRAHHKSLVFFRSLLFPPLADHMICM